MSKIITKPVITRQVELHRSKDAIIEYHESCLLTPKIENGKKKRKEKTLNQ